MRSLIALLSLAIAWASCTKPKDLTFVDIQNIRVMKLGFTDSEIGMDIRFFNPNNQRVQLKDAVAKVYVNAAYLGDTRMDTTIPVPKNDTFSVPLVLNVKSMTAISKVVESLQDSTVNILVDGSVKMGKAGVFTSFPIKYNKVQRVSELTDQLNVGF